MEGGKDATSVPHWQDSPEANIWRDCARRWGWTNIVLQMCLSQKEHVICVQTWLLYDVGPLDQNSHSVLYSLVRIMMLSTEIKSNMTVYYIHTWIYSVSYLHYPKDHVFTIHIHKYILNPSNYTRCLETPMHGVALAAKMLFARLPYCAPRYLPCKFKAINCYAISVQWGRHEWPLSHFSHSHLSDQCTHKVTGAVHF